MKNMTIVKKDITTLNVDCIVNAANSSLRYGGGVCGSIFEAAGISQLTRACNVYGHCETGKAVITPSFNINNVKYIIHAVGPIYSYARKEQCKDQLYSAYISSLELMLENSCSSIAFPLISSGIYGYPKEEAWKVALEACNSFMSEHKDMEIEIFFAVVSEAAFELGSNVLKEIEK